MRFCMAGSRATHESIVASMYPEGIAMCNEAARTLKASMCVIVLVMANV
jgi:hypothetical protein